jgi:hypothetical protein
LQVVSFGACDANRLALNGGLDFHLAVFDEALEFFGGLTLDAFAHFQCHLHFVAPHFLHIAFVNEANVDLAFGEFGAQDVFNLGQLKIRISNEGDHFVFEFNGGCRALEVKPGADFFGGVFHCVFDFNEIGFANCIE